MDEIKTNKLGLILLLTVALLGVVLVLFQTRYGPGTTGDSVNYLMGTQNLLDGNGYSRTSGGGEIRPLTMRPPLYSIALMPVGFTNLDLLEWARIFQAILFGVNAFLAGTIILVYTQSKWPALIGALFILLTKNIVLYHSWVFTEGLFIFFMFLVFLALARNLDHRKTTTIVLAGVATGLSVLTRYIGVSLVLTGIVSIMALSNSRWKERLLDCLLFGGVIIVPTVAWLIRNLGIAGTAVNRKISYHPMPAELIRAYRAEVSFWFVPAEIGFPHNLRKALMLIMGIPGPAIFFLLEFRDKFIRKAKDHGVFWALPWILLIFIISYVASLFLTLTFIDAVVDYYVVSRYLLPVYVCAIILFVTVFYKLIWQDQKGVILRAIVLIVALSLMTLYGYQTFRMIQDPVQEMGYTGHKVNYPEVVERLEAVNKLVPIISNDPEMVYIFINRPAYMMPIQYDFNAMVEREDFNQQVEATREKLQKGGVLVLFAPMSEAELEVVNMLNAELLDTFTGSLFYGYPEAMAE